MSSSKFLLKPPVLISGLILLMLIAMSAGLQKKVADPNTSEETERTELDRLETGRTRIATLNAPSAVSGQRQTTAERAPTAAKQEPRKRIVEDFNTALRRAHGNSYMTGRIFGSDNSEEGRQQRRESTAGSFESRTSNGDGNTSGGSDDNSSGRSNWGDRGNWAERFGRNVPVASAEVQLYEDDPNTTHPPLRTALTDDQGSFTIASLNDADQRYIMVVKAENYAPEATYVTMSHEPRQVFMRLEEGHELRGRVLDRETSEPVAGAVIYQPNSRWEAFSALGTTTSSINGEFVFPNVQRGNSLTQAQASGYATTRARVRAPDENTIIEMQSGGASISGVTLDRLTGKPHGGARIWAENGRDTRESVISAEDGTFTIDNLPEGTFEVYAVRGRKSKPQVIELERRQKISDVELILPAEVLVSGLVINASDRKPLEGIKVWFESSKGAQHRKTNAEGRFAFETMAIDEYSILIHEKGFLPVKDKRSPGSDETITREISKNQSSDEVTIRLRPVPTLEGNVRAEGGRGRGRGGFGAFLSGGFGGRSGAGSSGGGGTGGGIAAAAASASGSGAAAGGEAGDQQGTPVSGADLTLSYVDGTELVQLTTKSDAAGNFFFNLPKGRGQGIVVAKNQFLMDVKDIKVPRKKPVQLTLKRELMIGSLLLSDESPLDGVRVDVSRWIPRNRADSEKAKRVTMTNMNSMQGGRIFSALPRDQDIELTFYMPDGVAVSKDFKTNQLLNSRPIFVYDPVSQDILADISPRERKREGGGRRGGNRGDRPNNGGEGGERRNNQNNNGGAQPSPARENDGGQGAVPVTGQPAAAPAQ